MSYRLYIPGPVEVSPDTFEAMCQPMMSHRAPEFAVIYDSIQSRLKSLFNLHNTHVFISTSSSWGMLEGALRNVCNSRVLCCVSGLFSEVMHKIAQTNGFEAHALAFDWGQPVDPELLRKELSTGKYDTLTLVHSETATGTLNPIEDIMAVAREFPNVITIVDAVSSFTAMDIDIEGLGIDILVAGCQKALALPPGIAVCTVSQKALDRAKSLGKRQFYFDFQVFKANHEIHGTPTTCAVSLFYALNHKLQQIEKETVPVRYERHRRLNLKVRNWAQSQGFQLFPAPGYEAIALTCVKNNLNIDIERLIRALKDRYNCVIDGGLFKLKGITFRISNMGDETDEGIDYLINALNELMKDFKQ